MSMFFFAIFLWLKKFTSATWGYVSALYDKIMKQRTGI